MSGWGGSCFENSWSERTCRFESCVRRLAWWQNWQMHRTANAVPFGECEVGTHPRRFVSVAKRLNAAVCNTVTVGSNPTGYFGIWCNGSTAASDTAGFGSNPNMPAWGVSATASTTAFGTVNVSSNLMRPGK